MEQHLLRILGLFNGRPFHGLFGKTDGVVEHQELTFAES